MHTIPPVLCSPFQSAAVLQFLRSPKRWCFCCSSSPNFLFYTCDLQCLRENGVSWNEYLPQPVWNLMATIKGGTRVITFNLCSFLLKWWFIMSNILMALLCLSVWQLPLFLLTEINECLVFHTFATLADVSAISRLWATIRPGVKIQITWVSLSSDQPGVLFCPTTVL